MKARRIFAACFFFAVTAAKKYAGHRPDVFLQEAKPYFPREALFSHAAMTASMTALRKPFFSSVRTP